MSVEKQNTEKKIFFTGALRNLDEMAKKFEDFDKKVKFFVENEKAILQFYSASLNKKIGIDEKNKIMFQLEQRIKTYKQYYLTKTYKDIEIGNEKKSIELLSYEKGEIDSFDQAQVIDHLTNALTAADNYLSSPQFDAFCNSCKTLTGMQREFVSPAANTDFNKLNKEMSELGKALAEAYQEKLPDERLNIDGILDGMEMFPVQLMPRIGMFLETIKNTSQLFSDERIPEDIRQTLKNKCESLIESIVEKQKKFQEHVSVANSDKYEYLHVIDPINTFVNGEITLSKTCASIIDKQEDIINFFRKELESEPEQKQKKIMDDMGKIFHELECANDFANSNLDKLFKIDLDMEKFKATGNLINKSGTTISFSNFLANYFMFSSKNTISKRIDSFKRISDIVAKNEALSKFLEQKASSNLNVKCFYTMIKLHNSMESFYGESIKTIKELLVDLQSKLDESTVSAKNKLEAVYSTEEDKKKAQADIWDNQSLSAFIGGILDDGNKDKNSFYSKKRKTGTKNSAVRTVKGDFLNTVNSLYTLVSDGKYNLKQRLPETVSVKIEKPHLPESKTSDEAVLASENTPPPRELPPESELPSPLSSLNPLAQRKPVEIKQYLPSNNVRQAKPADPIRNPQINVSNVTANNNVPPPSDISPWRPKEYVNQDVQNTPESVVISDVGLEKNNIHAEDTELLKNKDDDQSIIIRQTLDVVPPEHQIIKENKTNEPVVEVQLPSVQSTQTITSSVVSNVQTEVQEGYQETSEVKDDKGKENEIDNTNILSIAEEKSKKMLQTNDNTRIHQNTLANNNRKLVDEYKEIIAKVLMLNKSCPVENKKSLPVKVAVKIVGFFKSAIPKKENKNSNKFNEVLKDNRKISARSKDLLNRLQRYVLEVDANPLLNAEQKNLIIKKFTMKICNKIGKKGYENIPFANEAGYLLNIPPKEHEDKVLKIINKQLSSDEINNAFKANLIDSVIYYHNKLFKSSVGISDDKLNILREALKDLTNLLKNKDTLMSFDFETVNSSLYRAINNSLKYYNTWMPSSFSDKLGGRINLFKKMQKCLDSNLINSNKILSADLLSQLEIQNNALNVYNVNKNPIKNPIDVAEAEAKKIAKSEAEEITKAENNWRNIKAYVDQIH